MLTAHGTGQLPGKRFLQEGNSRCGVSWEDANSKCGTPCPGMVDSECPAGESCFGDLTCTPVDSGGGGSVSSDPTGGGTVSGEPIGSGSGSPPSSGSGGNYCGTSWEDANSKCGTPCPGMVDSECPSGESCFGDLTCTPGGSAGGGTTSEDPVGGGTAPVDPVSRDQTSSGGNYCGTSWEDANSKCATACPGMVDSECPAGETCFSNVPCTTDTGPQVNECGGTIECPIKACCSKWGFCGWTEDFCNADCQSNCELTVTPQCDQAASMTREVGYYASWATARPCTQIRPSDIDSALYTHLIFSFAAVSENHELVPAQESDRALYEEFVNLKSHNSNLKVIIAVGGWAFNDPPTQNRFSDMASTKENREVFINSAVNLMGQYGFDGIDIDWEYPGADDRGGRPEDVNNFADLLQEMHDAFQQTATRFTLSIAAPLSNWYLRHFNLERIHPVVDFLNIMAYDIHGVWDANIEGLGPYVRSHTNITEIEQSLNMFFKNGVPADKLVMGTGAYGRSFTLSDPSCTAPGCPFSGPGSEGQCTQAAGTLAYFEIIEILNNNPNAVKVYDAASMSNYLYFDTQWISYDDTATFSERRNYATNKCLGGIMVWSVDMISIGARGLEPQPVEAEPPAQVDNQFKENIIVAAEACFNGFFANIPPTFCWKQGGDAGKIPTDCPENYFRSLALCFENCREGYGHILGVCYENCNEGYADHGLSCFKHLFDWYFKSSYIPDSKTNFEVDCDEGFYLSGALCYRDCGKIGLENCGIGACAGSGGLCGASIAMMTVDFAIGLAEAIAFVLTLGASSAGGGILSGAKDKLKQTFQNLSKESLQGALQRAKDWISKQTKEEIMKKMAKAARDHVTETVSDKVLESICNEIGEKIIGDLKEDSPTELQFQDFDPTGISGIVSGCEQTGTEAQNLECAKSVLKVVDLVDPTGLTAMAASFMHPTCDSV